MSKTTEALRIVDLYDKITTRAVEDLEKRTKDMVGELDCVTHSDIERILSQLPDKLVPLYVNYKDFIKTIRVASEDDLDYLLDVNDFQYRLSREKLVKAKSLARDFLEKKFADYLYTGYNYSNGSLDHVFDIAYKEKISEGYKAVEDRFIELMAIIDYIVDKEDYRS